MRTRPDGDYKWIAHAKDHFTRFSWACPLTTKEAKYVAGFLLSIFTQFGAPTILQSDNGKEFVASIIKEIVALWPSTKIINGRPRHPQSQGLIEKGNDVLEVKLSSWLEENRRNDWSTGLPFVICKRCKAIDIIII
jgi:transposase InsO family protein